jgi:peptide/nickel transport system substrate-binding protein
VSRDDVDGPPRDGGTLLLVGAAGIDHLDTASADLSHSRQVQRAFARQLFSYPACDDWSAVTRPVPDVALRTPTVQNGDVDPSGTVYRIRLRNDVRWSTTPPRRVVAADFVRGLQRLANPLAQCGGIGYFISTIAGMAEFAEAYAELGRTTVLTPSACAAFQAGHPVSGLVAEADDLLRISLVEPDPDLVNILALGYASAAPEEYDQVLPGAGFPAGHLLSDGPYVLAQHVPDRVTVLTRNPAWSTTSDPVRAAHIDRIVIDHTVVDAREAQRRVEAGEADLVYALPVPHEDLDRLAGHDGFAVHPGFILNPYVVFNLLDERPGAPGRDPRFRQALQRAVDKVAVNDVYGTAATNRPQHGVIPPGVNGYRPFDLYPTPGDRGDPVLAARLLREAGYEGAAVTIAYRDSGFSPAIADRIGADLRRCGLAPRLRGVPGEEFYGRFMTDPANARRGAWDLAVAGYIPDWWGGGAGAIISPLFGSNTRLGTNNYGGFSDPDVDRLIEEARREADPTRAGDLWHAIDVELMRQSPIIPLQTHGTARFRGARVRDASFLPMLETFDLTNLWLSGPRPAPTPSEPEPREIEMTV